MRCKWMGWVFCKVLVFSLHFTSGLQSAVYPQLVGLSDRNGRHPNHPNTFIRLKPFTFLA